MFSQRSFRVLLVTATIFGSLAGHAQTICDGSDPTCAVGSVGAPGSVSDPGAVDPNPYDPNNPEDPGTVAPVPDVATRTFMVGQELNHQAVDVNALLAGSLDELPGFMLDSVEAEVANFDRGTFLELKVDGDLVSAIRARARTADLSTGLPVDVGAAGQVVELNVRGRAFIRQVRFHLVRGN